MIRQLHTVDIFSHVRYVCMDRKGQALSLVPHTRRNAYHDFKTLSAYSALAQGWIQLTWLLVFPKCPALVFLICCPPAPDPDYTQYNIIHFSWLRDETALWPSSQQSEQRGMEVWEENVFPITMFCHYCPGPLACTVMTRGFRTNFSFNFLHSTLNAF